MTKPREKTREELTAEIEEGKHFASVQTRMRRYVCLSLKEPFEQCFYAEKTEYDTSENNRFFL